MAAKNGKGGKKKGKKGKAKKMAVQEEKRMEDPLPLLRPEIEKGVPKDRIRLPGGDALGADTLSRGTHVEVQSTLSSQDLTSEAEWHIRGRYYPGKVAHSSLGDDMQYTYDIEYDYKGRLTDDQLSAVPDVKQPGKAIELRNIYERNGGGLNEQCQVHAEPDPECALCAAAPPKWAIEKLLQPQMPKMCGCVDRCLHQLKHNRNWAVPVSEKTTFHSKRGNNFYTPSDCGFFGSSSRQSLRLMDQRDQVGFVGSYTDICGVISGERSTKNVVVKAVSEASMRSTPQIATVPRTVISRENGEKMLKQYSGLIKHLNKQEQPDAEVYVRRATILSTLGKHAQAIRDAERALELCPSMPVAHYRHGWAKHALGDFQGAANSFRRGLRGDSTNKSLKAGLDAAMLELNNRKFRA
jgi:hypothetical protein